LTYTQPDELVAVAAQYDVGLALEQPVSRNREICLTNKIFIYLLAGNVVIATDTMGQRPIVKEIGQAGRLYKQGDIKCLAEGLKKWALDRGALKIAREKAWTMGEKYYNWDIEKKKFLPIVEKTLNRRRKSGA